MINFKHQDLCCFCVLKYCNDIQPATAALMFQFAESIPYFKKSLDLNYLQVTFMAVLIWNFTAHYRM